MPYTSNNNHFSQDPDEKLDYKIEWDDGVLLDGETIVDSVWNIPDNMTGENDTHTDTDTVIWLSSGDLSDEKYAVENTITTSVGRIYQRTLYIHMVDK